MPRSTEHYGLPYPLESDTIRSLPGILQQLSTRIAAVLGEIEEKAQKASSNTNEARRSAKAAEEAAASVSKLPDGINEMLKAWGNLGKKGDPIIYPLMERIAALEGIATPTLKDNQVQVDFTEETPKIVAGDTSIIKLIKKPYVRLSAGTYRASADVLTNRAELFRAGETFQGEKYVKFGNYDMQVLIFTRLS